MSKLKLFFINFTPSLIVSLLLVLLVYAWTDPTSQPPGGNVPAPINVGDQSQLKIGALGVGGVFRAYGGSNSAVLSVVGDKVGIGTNAPTQKLDVEGYIRGSTGLCIGNDCRTSWPSGGTGISINQCQLCFNWAPSSNNADPNQCNRNSSPRLSCVPIDSWITYIDDTDDRTGGCVLRWKIDCTPPYGDGASTGGGGIPLNEPDRPRDPGSDIIQ